MQNVRHDNGSPFRRQARRGERGSGQQNESDEQVGTDNIASYNAGRASENAAENANNLAEVGANDGYEQSEDEKP